jgi:hypothetical protein
MFVDRGRKEKIVFWLVHLLMKKPGQDSALMVQESKPGRGRDLYLHL